VVLRSNARIRASSQHQDGQVVSGAAQLPADLEAVQPRHHHIEHHRVRTIVGDGVQGLDPVLGQGNRIPVEGKGSAQRLAHCAIVIDDKYPHGHQC
jgi:hypothetical protein